MNICPNRLKKPVKAQNANDIKPGYYAGNVYTLGIQTHVWYDTDLKPEKLQNFQHDFANLGLKILVTAMDVTNKDLPTDTVVCNCPIVGVYKNILLVMLTEPAVIGVNTWDKDKYWSFSDFAA